MVDVLVTKTEAEALINKMWERRDEVIVSGYKAFEGKTLTELREMFAEGRYNENLPGADVLKSTFEALDRDVQRQIDAELDKIDDRHSAIREALKDADTLEELKKVREDRKAEIDADPALKGQVEAAITMAENIENNPTAFRTKLTELQNAWSSNKGTIETRWKKLISDGLDLSSLAADGSVKLTDIDIKTAEADRVHREFTGIGRLDRSEVAIILQATPAASLPADVRENRKNLIRNLPDARAGDEPGDPGKGGGAEDFLGKAGNWLSEAFSKHPIMTVGIAGAIALFAGGMLGSGGGFLGGMAGGLLKIVGTLGLLWAGGNLLFKGITGHAPGVRPQGAGAKINDPSRTINAPEAEVQVQLTVGEVAQSTHKAYHRLGEQLAYARGVKERAGGDPAKVAEAEEIERVANEMRTRLAEQFNRLKEGKLTPAQQAQLYAVSDRINDATNPIEAIKDMQANGVSTPNSQTQLTELLKKHPEIMTSAAVDSGGKKVIGSQSVDAIMRKLRDDNRLNVGNSDPLGVGIRVNTEQSLRASLVEALTEVAKDPAVNIEIEAANTTLPAPASVTFTPLAAAGPAMLPGTPPRVVTRTGAPVPAPGTPGTGTPTVPTPAAADQALPELQGTVADSIREAWDRARNYKPYAAREAVLKGIVEDRMLPSTVKTAVDREADGQIEIGAGVEAVLTKVGNSYRLDILKDGSVPLKDREVERSIVFDQNGKVNRENFYRDGTEFGQVSAGTRAELQVYERDRGLKFRVYDHDSTGAKIPHETRIFIERGGDFKIKAENSANKTIFEAQVGADGRMATPAQNDVVAAADIGSRNRLMVAAAEFERGGGDASGLAGTNGHTRDSNLRDPNKQVT